MTALRMQHIQHPSNLAVVFLYNGRATWIVAIAILVDAQHRAGALSFRLQAASALALWMDCASRLRRAFS
jgi:hypothetical protein